jgi:hypothetical protein
MSPGIKSRLPFGVSARLDNQRDYIKAITQAHDKHEPRVTSPYSPIERKLSSIVVTITNLHELWNDPA